MVLRMSLHSFVLAALGLRRCLWDVSSSLECELLLAGVYGLLPAVTSLVAEHRF